MLVPAGLAPTQPDRNSSPGGNQLSDPGYAPQRPVPCLAVTAHPVETAGEVRRRSPHPAPPSNKAIVRPHVPPLEKHQRPGRVRRRPRAARCGVRASHRPRRSTTTTGARQTPPAPRNPRYPPPPTLPPQQLTPMDRSLRKEANSHHGKGPPAAKAQSFVMETQRLAEPPRQRGLVLDHQDLGRGRLTGSAYRGLAAGPPSRATRPWTSRTSAPSWDRRVFSSASWCAGAARRSAVRPARHGLGGSVGVRHAHVHPALRAPVEGAVGDLAHARDGQVLDVAVVAGGAPDVLGPGRAVGFAALHVPADWATPSPPSAVFVCASSSPPAPAACCRRGGRGRRVSSARNAVYSVRMPKRVESRTISSTSSGSRRPPQPDLVHEVRDPARGPHAGGEVVE